MLKSLVVSKSNQLARTGNNLSLTEAKMVEYCLSTIYKDDKIQPDTLFDIDVEAMGRHFGMSRSNAYRELKQAFLSIKDKRLCFPLGTEGWVMDTSWIVSVSYNNSLDGIRIRFSPDIIPHISGDKIKSNFTAYRLEDIANLKSSYSVILYNLCKSYAYEKGGYSVEMPLQDLRVLLNIQDNEYKLFGDFNRVLKRCSKEIQEQTGLAITTVLRKRGKEVDRVVFLMKYITEEQT